MAKISNLIKTKKMKDEQNSLENTENSSKYQKENILSYSSGDKPRNEQTSMFAPGPQMQRGTPALDGSKDGCDASTELFSEPLNSSFQNEKE